MPKGRTAIQAVEFGYKCQECGQGTVVQRVFPEYKTKLRGYPVTVENARIGVCDRCGAEHFDPNETLRWRTELEEKRSGTYLQPTEIEELRKQLGLSMEHFAILIGCTRQSLHNWERLDRSAPQSRMADLFMRLVRESHTKGRINVLSFLTEEASRLGFQLTVSPKSRSVTPVVAFARRVPLNQLSVEEREPFALAADTEGFQDAIILVTEDNKRIARVSYDYQNATLNLAFLHQVPFVEFDTEIQFKDGERATGEHTTIRDREAILLRKTKHTEEDVVQVQFCPQEAPSASEKK